MLYYTFQSCERGEIGIQTEENVVQTDPELAGADMGKVAAFLGENIQDVLLTSISAYIFRTHRNNRDDLFRLT